MESVLRREIVLDKVIVRIFAVLFFIIAITLGAFVRIPLPFTPVPLTMQTFFVLLSAAFLGMKLGLFIQLSYIFLGFIGIPVFTGESAGLTYFFNPTAGYLLGFVLATIFIASTVNCCKNNFILISLIFCLASALLLLSGVIWLKLSLHLSWLNSFLMGFVPFVPTDLAKSVLAAALFCKLKPRVSSIL